MSDDPSTLTRYAGFYKTIQCLGAGLASLTNGDQLHLSRLRMLCPA